MMMGTRFLASFGRLLTGSATAAQANDSADIELHDLSSRKAAVQPRACQHHAGPDRAKRLVDRVCESISSGLNAALSDLRALFTESKKEPESAGSAAKKPKAGSAAGNRGTLQETRQRHGKGTSRYRLATLKEMLAREPGRRPSAELLIRRINLLQFHGRLAGQLAELSLGELRFLWSQASKGKADVMRSEARKTLSDIGHERLCQTFKAEARHYGRSPNASSRELPRWAAKAPAEWRPREALVRAYCVE